MVLDGLAVASTVISLMVNGMCCLWQQQEEQKLREAIRHDVRTEYWHHRRSMDLQTRVDPDDGNHIQMDADDIKHIQEERRKKLMITKMKIKQQRMKVQNDRVSKSDPHFLGNLDSDGNSFHNNATVGNAATKTSSNNVDCINAFRGQSVSLLDSCDTEVDDLDDIYSASYVDICLD